MSSCARRPARAAAVVPLLGECMAFIEWTAPRVAPEMGGELAEIQILLALWREAWTAAQEIPAQRALLSFSAKTWSDRVLDQSGLVAQAEERSGS